MPGIRLQRLAQVLVRYSLGLKKGKRNVDRCIKHTLFDEKMGGTVHLALGASLPETGGSISPLYTGIWCAICEPGVNFASMASYSAKMVSLSCNTKRG
ncbi:MAG TPA: hypothetical protein VKV20_06445 [Ktedonobacteraceae bacterium]|jgi:hypothetical protein|nr:hypothetical protein [Ktedonobacteraceae bacterium]